MVNKLKHVTTGSGENVTVTEYPDPVVTIFPRKFCLFDNSLYL